MQVIEYTRLELRHDTLIMQWCFMPVVGLVMVLLRSGQYLQFLVWLQYWKPLSFGCVPCLGLDPWVREVSFAIVLASISGVLGLTKSNMDICLVGGLTPMAAGTGVSVSSGAT